MLGQRRRCLPLAFLAAALPLAGGTGSGQDPVVQQPPPAAWKLTAPFTQTWATEVTQTVTAGKGETKVETTTKRTVTTKVKWEPKPDPKAAADSKDQKFELTITSVEVKGTIGKDVTHETKDVAGAKLAVTLTREDAGLKVQVGEAGDKPKLSAAQLKEVERTIRAAFPDLKAKAANKDGFDTAAGKYATDTAWTFKDGDKKKAYTGKSEWKFEAKADAAAKVAAHALSLTGTLTFDTDTGLADEIKLASPTPPPAVAVTVPSAGGETTVDVQTSYTLTITTAVEKK